MFIGRIFRGTPDLGTGTNKCYNRSNLYFIIPPFMYYKHTEDTGEIQLLPSGFPLYPGDRHQMPMHTLLYHGRRHTGAGLYHSLSDDGFP
jgi:hypothetical protein